MARSTYPSATSSRRSRAARAEIAAPVWYIAGPVEDVKHVRELLGSIGVGKEDIRLEAFRYAGSLASPSLPVCTPDWDQVYRGAAGE